MRTSIATVAVAVVLLGCAPVADEPDETVTVEGYLFVHEGELPRLCPMVLESYPPQCGGDAVEVEGLDVERFDLEEEQGVRWTNELVAVTGRMSDDVLVVQD